MKTYVKVGLSITGVFLGGLTAAYTANPTGPWLGWVMAGLAPVGAYLVGFYQVNPANQPAGTDAP